MLHNLHDEPDTSSVSVSIKNVRKKSCIVMANKIRIYVSKCKFEFKIYTFKIVLQKILGA